MESIANRLEFAPPRDKGSLRAFGLALLVHVLLIAALTWGVNWKRSDETASFEAELWSGAAQPAAPRRIEAPPPPPPAPEPPPTPVPVPSPPPPPVARAPEVRETPPLREVDIALEREKKRKLLQQQKEAEVRKAQKLQDRRDAELQARKEKELAERQAQALAQKAEVKKQAARELAIEKEKEKRSAAANAVAAAEKQRQAALEKQKSVAAAAAAVNAEKQKLAAAAAAKQKAAAEAAAASEKQRQAAIQQRIMSMAGAAGSGTAKAKEPSDGYANKVVAKVLPNVVFTDEIVGNPKADVVVTSAPDGTIIGRRLDKPSGNKAWDEAVLKAIDRTGAMPRDVDGTVPKSMTIGFQPRKN